MGRMLTAGQLKHAGQFRAEWRSTMASTRTEVFTYRVINAGSFHLLWQKSDHP
jgi:hypothetical protein